MDKMLIMLFISAWIASGFLGSWLVLSAVFREPWFDGATRPSVLTPFPALMAIVGGPFNLLAGVVYAVIFRKAS